MKWTWVRLSGGLLLLLQAGLLQLVWIFQPTSHELLAGITIIFNIAAMLDVLAALGFLFLRHIGWLTAMIVQGLCLFTAILVYFTSDTLAAHLTMMYSMVMVLYLNSFEVQTSFRGSSGGLAGKGDTP